MGPGLEMMRVRVVVGRDEAKRGGWEREREGEGRLIGKVLDSNHDLAIKLVA